MKTITQMLLRFLFLYPLLRQSFGTKKWILGKLFFLQKKKWITIPSPQTVLLQRALFQMELLTCNTHTRTHARTHAHTHTHTLNFINNGNSMCFKSSQFTGIYILLFTMQIVSKQLYSIKGVIWCNFKFSFSLECYKLCIDKIPEVAKTKVSKPKRYSLSKLRFCHAP